MRIGRPERGASWRQARPEVRYLSRHAATVTRVTASVVATSVRVLPRSSSSRVVARGRPLGQGAYWQGAFGEQRLEMFAIRVGESDMLFLHLCSLPDLRRKC